MALVCTFVLGCIAGQRSMLGPALAAWAVRLGIVAVAGTRLAFMGYHYACLILTVCALGEMVVDKLPFTPSRKAAGPFGARMVTGALTGATIGAVGHSIVLFAAVGVVGAVVGTLAGYAARMRLAAAFGRDWPAALLEDVVAIGLGVLCVEGLR